MTITLWIRHSHLNELSSILNSPWPRKHQITLYERDHIKFLSFPTLQINVTLEEYQKIKDWQENTDEELPVSSFATPSADEIRQAAFDYSYAWRDEPVQRMDDVQGGFEEGVQWLLSRKQN
jgi:hypothetical protein